MAGISKKKIKTKNSKTTKYTISYYDVFGKQHTSGIYDTIKEAKRHLWKFEKVETNKKDVTYGLIFKQFLSRAQKKYAENTYKNYLYYYNKHFVKIENVSYTKIKSIAWQSFFDDLETKTSPHIAQACLKMAKAAINYAIKHELVDNNVLQKIDKIEIPKAVINHLTIKEIKNILAECKNAYPQYYVLLFTFVGTGAREGEILALNKKDFLPEEKAIVINKQFTRNRLKQKPKTAPSNRKIYLFDELTQELTAHIQKLDEHNDLLFPNNAGNYINASNLRRRFWYPLLELCGVSKRVRLHDLRGSYTDMALSSGLSVKFAQNQMGHAKAQTTTDIYAQNNHDMIMKAQNTFNNIFQKYEQNMSMIENYPNKKIIHFPKRRVDSFF